MAVTSPDRPTVLALRAPGIGDLLTAVPALRALRRGLPGTELVLATPARLAGLVTLIGAVDRVVPADGPESLHWTGRPPRLAVNLHGSGPQSIDALQATRPDELLTHRHPARPDVPGPPWRGEVHEVRRWCDLVTGHGLDADPLDLDLAVPDRPAPARGTVVVVPGAAHPSRQWPAERFAEVARALHGDGRQVVVTGGPAERELTAAVTERAGLPPSADLGGRCSPAALAALVAAARLVVCGDTGPAHLATAYRTPSVLLFGPTPPHRWGPARDDRHTVLWAGGLGDPHGDRTDPGLLRIGTGEVLSAARHHLGHHARRRGPAQGHRGPAPGRDPAGFGPPGTGDTTAVTPDHERDDLVDVLVVDHRRLLDLLDRAPAAGNGRARSELARHAVDAVRRHCATEERLLHPVLRRCLDDGERCAETDTEEHEQLERLVGELLEAGPASPGAGDVLRRLAASARRHVEGVESRRLPVLRECLTVSELHALARQAQAELDRGDRPGGPSAMLG